MNSRIGAGFNYAFEANPGNTAPLQLPPQVSFMEAGVTELQKINSDSPMAQRELSLHLSRTPVTEKISTQLEYISYIQNVLEKLPSTITSKIISIGLHLTGSRFEGNGLLGGADSYRAVPENLYRAAEFIAGLQAKTGLPVWLENANFYSEGVDDVFGSWAHVKTLCHDLSCSAILDLAHIAVEANNNGMRPEIILGSVPWQYISEVHLSGITHGHDGSMHDGHSHPIPDVVWNLLATSLPLLPREKLNQVIFTVEHTPPSWAGRVDVFHSDFSRLQEELARPRQITCFSDTRGKYMRGFLRYIITGQIPRLSEACRQRGIVLDDILEHWLSSLNEEGRRVIFDLGEVPPSEHSCSAVLTSEFLKFAKTQLRGVDTENA